MATIQSLHNVALWLNGVHRIGVAKELTLPTMTTTQRDFSALGLMGKAMLPTGMDAMEGSIVLNAPNPQFLSLAANPNAVRQLVGRGSLEEFNSSVGRVSQVPYSVTISAMFKDLNMGSFTSGEANEPEVSYNCLAFKLEIGGVVVFDYDTYNNIFKVNGEEVNADLRTNFGL